MSRAVGRQRFGGPDVPAERQLSDLENTLALIKLDPTEKVPLLAPLLDIPVPPERRPILAPEELRRRQLAALTNWVVAGARAQPIVLILEDLHWADPTTLDVLRGIAERGARGCLDRYSYPIWRKRMPSCAISMMLGTAALTVIEATKEKWHEAEVNRTAGEIALMLPERDAAKADHRGDSPHDRS
jgi:predicted ATPase